MKARAKIRVKWLGNFILLAAVTGFISFSFPQIYGLKCYGVVSGSMCPALPVGSAVYIQEKNPEEIEEGEIITFTTEEGGTVITHRVVENNKGQQVFITKGDANDNIDISPVKWKNLCGKVVLCIPFAGYLLKFLGSWNGKITAILFLLAFYLVAELLEGKNKKESERH